MALCDKPCCNAEARAAIKRANEVLFEAYLVERARIKAVEAAPVAESNDVSYAEAMARIEENPRYAIEHVEGSK